MNDKGIMTNGVIGNLRITTDIIAERDSLQRALEKAAVFVDNLDVWYCPYEYTDNDIITWQNNSCGGVCPTGTKVRECWLLYFKEEKE